MSADVERVYSLGVMHAACVDPRGITWKMVVPSPHSHH